MYQVYQVYRIVSFSHDSKQKQITVVRVYIKYKSPWYTTRFPVLPINKGFLVN